MQKSDILNPHAFLRERALVPSDIEARYPNAKRMFKGGLFISHDGRDFARIRETVVHPIVFERFMDGFFLHNRKSVGSSEYREMVRTALYYLDKFLLVVSRYSLLNDWVHAEVSVAIDLGRPMIVCLFDDSDPITIHRLLGSVPRYLRLRSRVTTVDFRGPLESAQEELARRLDEMLASSPYAKRLDMW